MKNLKRNKPYIINQANNFLLLALAAAVLIVRILGNIVFFTFNLLDNPVIAIWNVLAAFAIVFPVIIYFYRSNKESIGKMDNLTVNFFKDLRWIIILTTAFIISIFFLPDITSQNSRPGNIFSLLYIELFDAFGLFTSLFVYKFLHKWLMIRRHKKTKRNIKILSFSLIYFVLVDIYWTSINQDIAGVVGAIIFVILLAVTMTTARKNTWIALLPGNEKGKLILQSTLQIILSFIILFYAFDDNSDFYKSFLHYLSGLVPIVAMSYVYLIALLARIFLSAVAALPTSDIVERHSQGISSLSYLNNIVARNVEFEDLIEIVTKLAMNSTSAEAAWTEIYDSGRIRIMSATNFNPQRIVEVHQQFALKDKFTAFDRPYYISSIPESEEFHFLKKLLPFASSMIITPIITGKERIGSLIVCKHDEFGFEPDAINVMTAFSENVSIAIDNSRLLKEAIENEHYRRELQIAKEMQQKLLPSELQEIQNYSISAFSLPADVVGGDFYDVVNLSNGNPCVVIGDVSGKGMNAAFFMAHVKGVLLAHSKIASGPADLLMRMNETLIRSMEKQMFVTVSAVEIVNNSGMLRFARAGHTPLVIKAESIVNLMTPKGLGIGLVGPDIFDPVLEEIELTLSRNDVCLLFTDGVNELLGADNSEFGLEPLKRIAAMANPRDAKEIDIDIRNALAGHSVNGIQHDDMTVFSIVFNGN